MAWNVLGSFSSIIETVTNVVVAISPIAVAWIGYLQYDRKKLQKSVKQANEQLDNAAALLTWDEWSQHNRLFEREVRRLEEDTEITRVLAFRAVNGFADPKRTTQVFESRKPIPQQQDPGGYIYYPIEPEYVNMLHEAEEKGHIKFTVADLGKDHQMRGIYDAEGVKASAWFFLYRVPGKIEGTWAIVYASFSSHTHDEISPEAILRIQMLVSLLQQEALEHSRT